jgi:hypothetical protein
MTTKKIFLVKSIPYRFFRAKFGLATRDPPRMYERENITRQCWRYFVQGQADSGLSAMSWSEYLLRDTAGQFLNPCAGSASVRQPRNIERLSAARKLWPCPAVSQDGGLDAVDNKFHQ